MRWENRLFWLHIGRDLMRGFDRWHIRLVWKPGPNPPGWMISGTHIELTWRWERPRLHVQTVPTIEEPR